jgi:hypothetical protein
VSNSPTRALAVAIGIALGMALGALAVRAHAGATTTLPATAPEASDPEYLAGTDRICLLGCDEHLPLKKAVAEYDRKKR